MKLGFGVRGAQLKNIGGQAENGGDTFSLLDEGNASNCKKHLLVAQLQQATLTKALQLSCAGLNSVLCVGLWFYMDGTSLLALTPLSGLASEPLLCVFRGMTCRCTVETEWESGSGRGSSKHSLVFFTSHL